MVATAVRQARRDGKEIAAETGYSVATIYRHAQPLNMNMRPPWPDRTEYDEAWLRRQYVDQRMVVADIAAEAGVCVNSVGKAISRFTGAMFLGCSREP